MDIDRVASGAAIQNRVRGTVTGNNEGIAARSQRDVEIGHLMVGDEPVHPESADGRGGECSGLRSGALRALDVQGVNGVAGDSTWQRNCLSSRMERASARRAGAESR